MSKTPLSTTKQDTSKSLKTTAPYVTPGKETASTIKPLKKEEVKEPGEGKPLRPIFQKILNNIKKKIAEDKGKCENPTFQGQSKKTKSEKTCE